MAKKTTKKAAAKRSTKKSPAKSGKKLAVVRSKPQGIGAFARSLLKKKPDAPAAEILEKIQAQFKGVHTTAACVNWYRGKMRKAGEIKSKA